MLDAGLAHGREGLIAGGGVHLRLWNVRQTFRSRSTNVSQQHVVVAEELRDEADPLAGPQHNAHDAVVADGLADHRPGSAVPLL